VLANCRMCSSHELQTVIDLGQQYLSEFREDDSRPPRYPLILVRCEQCFLVQLKHDTPAAVMYHDQYSFKSGVSDAIVLNLADVVQHALEEWGEDASRPPRPRWLDIASNDGTLLSFVPKEFFRVGIDPLEHFAGEAANNANLIISDFFSPTYFRKVDTFDVITSVSMFYDVPDPYEFVKGVRSVLALGGVWVIQQNYLPAMLSNCSVDNISHEHLTYWSLSNLSTLLNQNNLVITDVTFSRVNGGCFRVIVRHASDPKTQVSESFQHALDREKRLRLDSFVPFELFADRASNAIAKIWTTVEKINKGGGSVFVYGASTRGAVLWQAAGLDVHDLPFVVDRNPEKVGRYMSAIQAPIISEEAAREMNPDYMLVGPWWFRDQFIEREREYLRRGGALIFPLPELEIVRDHDLD
jgi:NDP-4-keto-2,6-dideoxyhexose 3-C-methyltransferase